jgi:hypothetical protein
VSKRIHWRISNRSTYAESEIWWVDGQKPIFQVHLELVSTVTARDQHLHNFFLHMAKLNETRSIASLFPTAAELDAHKPLEVIYYLGYIHV